MSLGNFLIAAFTTLPSCAGRRGLAQRRSVRPAVKRHGTPKSENCIALGGVCPHLLFAAHLVNRAMQYIRENIKKNITTADVVHYLGVSRRLADLRLKQFQGETVASLISHARLDEAARWLKTSRITCSKIAEACAYENPKHLSNAFRRRFGMSMTDYRRRFGKDRILQKAAR